VFSPGELLKRDGIDELDTMRIEPNPFWNRPRLYIALGLPVMSGLLQSDRISIHQMRLDEFEVKRGGWTNRPQRMYAEHESKVKRAVDETIDMVKELAFPIFGLEK
jgi:hypothetical protein